MAKKKKTTKKKPVKKKKSLRVQQVAFCTYYVFGSDEKGDTFRIGHGGKSYAKAYAKDYNDAKQRAVCDDSAYKILRKPEILRYCQNLLDAAGWNDMAVDARLNQIIQEGSDKNAVAAIKLYNELKKRLIKQLDITTKGKSLQAIALEELNNDIDAEEESQIEEAYDEIEEDLAS